MSLVFIYGMVDPRDHRVRYVGKSITPQKRVYCHWTSRTRLDLPVANWLTELADLDLAPILVILEEVTDPKWQIAEYAWIGALYDHELLNVQKEPPERWRQRGSTAYPLPSALHLPGRAS